jgi:DNA polymerase-3 subunit delta'
VLEDADRLTEQAANVLLKAIEEPPARTVWLLCAPSSEDALPTIRSRCRQVRLVTPTPDAVTRLLIERDQVPQDVAVFAAHASQGISAGLGGWPPTSGPGSAGQPCWPCRTSSPMSAPACGRRPEVTEAAATEAKQATSELDAAEMESMKVAWRRIGRRFGSAKLASGPPPRSRIRGPTSAGPSGSSAMLSTARCLTWLRTTVTCRDPA